MEKSIENALTFEGYTSDISLAVMKAICNKLKSQTLTTLEIGYFKGRTTELVLENGSTKHIIIDCAANLNEKQLESFNKMLDKLNDNDDVIDVIHNLEEEDGE